MSKRLRIGLAGVGLIGRRHLDIAKLDATCDIVAAADPTTASEADVTKHEAQYYEDYRTMLDRESLDGVIIATPNSTHAQIGIACVEQKLPILIEKPITDTVAEGETLVTAAERANVSIAVGHHRRFDSAVETAKTLLDQGTIGSLRAVQCIWSLRKHDSYFDTTWRREQPGGGPVLINLIHDVDLLRHFCGDIVRVYAETTNTARDHNVEDVVAASLRFASGAIGTITASDAAPSPWGWEQNTGDNPDIPHNARNCYRFLGSKAALGFPRMDIWRHPRDVEDSWQQPISRQTEDVAPRAALNNQLRHFCDVIRGDALPRVSGRDGLATLATTTAILESAQSGMPVTLGPA